MKKKIKQFIEDYEPHTVFNDYYLRALHYLS